MTPLAQLILGTPGVDGSGDSAPVFGGKINDNYGILEPAINALEAITGALGSAANQDISAFAATVHSHIVADVTGLQSTLDAKADLVGGVIPTAQLPALAVTDYLGAASNETAMLALTGEKGDWCTRSDLGTTWVIVGADPSLLAGWQQLSYPTAPVTSVNAQTGAVVLGFADVGAASAAQGALADSALQSIVGDLTPQLGGDLDVNGKEIQSSTNIVFQLGDAAGANKLSVQDSAGVEVYNVASDGDTFWDNGVVEFTAGSASSTPTFKINGGEKLKIKGVGQAQGIQVTALVIGLPNEDTILERDAIATLAQRNGINAQTFRIYNTFTDSVNYERLALTGAGITVETAGTGTDNINLTLTPAGTGKVAVVGKVSVSHGIEITGGKIDAVGTNVELNVPSGRSFNIQTLGSNRWRVGADDGAHFGTDATDGPQLQQETPSAINPTVIPNRSDLDTGTGWRAANVGVLIAGAQNCMEFGGVSAAPQVGFYGTAAIAKQTGVAVTAAGIHAALVALGLIT